VRVRTTTLMRMIAWATATAARCEPRRCLRREDWARRAVRVRAAARAASTRARRMAGRDVAAPHPPVPQQLGQPLGVVAVGRPPRHIPRVARVHQRQLEPPLLRARSSLAARSPRCAPSPRGRSPPRVARRRAPPAHPSSSRTAAASSGPARQTPGSPGRPPLPAGGPPPHTRGGTPRPSLAHRHQAASVAAAAPGSVQGLSCVRCRAARNLLGAVWAPGTPSLADSLAGLARPCSSIAHPPLRRPQRTRSHHLCSSPVGAQRHRTLPRE
jgi:hypothetical protein